MANSSRQSRSTSTGPQSVVVKVQRLDDKGKPIGTPEHAASGSKWVVDGLADGSVKLVEEVPADVPEVPAPGDPAVSGNRNGS